MNYNQQSSWLLSQSVYPESPPWSDQPFPDNAILPPDSESNHPASPSQASNPLSRASRSRPGVHEQRADDEPRVYREIPSFPSFNEPVPDEATIEEICLSYPNHLRGSYLDAFIQWRWTPTDMYKSLTATAIKEFKEYGIATCKSYGNRANFLMKRMNSHLDGLDEEHVKALCTGPKIRGCMRNGREYYGASKLQGKFHNPTAQPVRKFPNRKARSRKGGTAKPQTFVKDNKEFVLWESREEFDQYKIVMAHEWSLQRGYAELILEADSGFFDSDRQEQNRWILRMTHWPVNSKTETFFSFERVHDCPAFVQAIVDKLIALLKEIFDASQDDNFFSHRQRLAMTRKSAIKSIVAEQTTRSSRLRELAMGPNSMYETGEMRYGRVPEAVFLTQTPAGQRTVATRHMEESINASDPYSATCADEVTVPPSPRKGLKRSWAEPAHEFTAFKRGRFMKPDVPDNAERVHEQHDVQTIDARTYDKAHQRAVPAWADTTALSIAPPMFHDPGLNLFSEYERTNQPIQLSAMPVYLSSPTQVPGAGTVQCSEFLQEGLELHNVWPGDNFDGDQPDLGLFAGSGRMLTTEPEVEENFPLADFDFGRLQGRSDVSGNDLSFTTEPVSYDLPELKDNDPAWLRQLIFEDSQNP